jgi:hypothetical protein
MSLGIPVAYPALSKYWETFSKKVDSGCYFSQALVEKYLTLVVIFLQSFDIICLRFV